MTGNKIKQRTIFSRIVMRAAGILIPCFALAQDDQLSLKHGTYVLESSECKQPPFAAMKSWDGAGFFGPHASGCTSRLLSRHGKRFSLSTTCTALTDGTPDLSDYVDTFSLTQLSKTRFVIHKENRQENTYRWCSAEGTNYPKEKP